MGRIGFFLVAGALFLILPVRAPGFTHSSVPDNSSFNAVVVLCDDGGHALEQSLSTDSGEFNFQGLHAGHYVLRVSAFRFRFLH